LLLLLLQVEAVDAGVLESRRHLNVRGKSATLPAITDKDWLDLKFGVEAGVDYFALSFVKVSSVLLACYVNDMLCDADKDWLDMKFGVEAGVDYVALSFVKVRSPTLRQQHFKTHVTGWVSLTRTGWI
jgi:pyruvate kinase